MTSVAPIETRQLTCRFGSHTALAPLDFIIPRGSVYALVGHNGAGKTTLMKLLLNMIRPTSGSASVLGVPSTQLTSSFFTRVGYVAEGQEMPDWMTVRAFMDYLRPFYPTWNEGTLLRDLELPDDRRISALSRGMRMKVALASVLAFQPELILMDEPFSGLDPLVRDELTRALLDRLSANGDTQPTVLISSHDLAEIEPFATHVAMLQSGRMLFAEPLEQLQSRFRDVTVTLPADVTRLETMPDDWLRPEYSGRIMRFVHTQWRFDHSQQEIRSALPAAGTIDAEPMSLRDIFLALTRSHASDRSAA